ncbi:sensor domain-containing protein [Alteribacter natronophilus]|uniref:sensor domain-containing protein n=1 Tax=Alteribacter natronophilus TaxID=2583810 RepID=UPI00110D5ECA|nr:EAL domain-containing protein [Alteribacter natronophilus]TMW71679.1 EAL domain-containing protein [Alteribacter natronophilus]
MSHEGILADTIENLASVMKEEEADILDLEKAVEQVPETEDASLLLTVIDREGTVLDSNTRYHNVFGILDQDAVLSSRSKLLSDVTESDGDILTVTHSEWSLPIIESDDSVTMDVAALPLDSKDKVLVAVMPRNEEGNGLQDLIENLHTFVMRVSGNPKEGFTVTYLEGKLAGKVGLSRVSGKGIPLFDLLPCEDKEKVTEYYQQAFAGERNEFTFKIKNYTLAAYVTIIPGEKDQREAIVSVQDITSLKQSENAVETMAYQDPLTGLPNRRMLTADLAELARNMHKASSETGLISIDIDHFKNINDSIGHTAGDRFIMMTAERLSRLESLVTVEHLKLYHLGGDEFVILAGGYEQRTFDALINYIDALFDEPFLYREGEFHLRASMGASRISSSTEPEELLKHADMALNQSKKAGGNRATFFSGKMQDEFLYSVRLENGLRQAIKDGGKEFTLYYQPVIDAEGERIIGCEALIRWNHPEIGLVPPGDFIKIAEESGLIIPIGEWVIREVCSQIKQWDAAGIEPVTVSINISSEQFQDASFVGDVISILTEEGVAFNRIQLEMTENGLMEDTKETLETLAELKRNGIAIAIDDFGTGYSSLSYLKQFEVQTLKIDQSFTRELTDNQGDKAIVAATIQLAKSLGLNVVAEGVETKEVSLYLKGIGCPHLQGFYYSKPLTPVLFEKFLSRPAQ